jgi:hypothetical protein
MAQDRNQERTRSPNRHSSHHRHRDRDSEDRKRRRSEHDSHHEQKRRRTPDSSDRKPRDHERHERHDKDRHDRDRRDRDRRDRDRSDKHERHNKRDDTVKIEERAKKEESEERQLEALRQGRQDRDKKFFKQERERTQFRSETEDVQYKAWLAQEDDFMLIQAKKRAVIRVREGRPKPIDAFVINLKLIEEDERPRILGDDEIEGDEFYITDPDDIIKVHLSRRCSNRQTLSVQEMTELKEDIKEYIGMEKSKRNKDFWLAITMILDDFQSRSTTAPESRAVINVSDDIDKLLSTKTYAQLETLEDQINAKLRGNEPVDVDYWEQLLRSLKVWKAKAFLRVLHEPVLKARPNPPKQSFPLRPLPTEPVKTEQNKQEEEETFNEELEDNEAFTQAASSMFDTETTRIVEEGVETEEDFNVEADDVEILEPAWANEHRPRKPKFFNRVVMGYEWNKYNQTHYDEANPPPKVVQGYKFNIFYPNLVDTSKTPTYKVERNRQKRRYVGGGGGTSAGEDETCIIRFTAGAPYLDVAFRIIDRDWDYSSRFNRGFKSSFDKVYFSLEFC